jgi:polyisoprenoid-binding protein YceI
MLMCFLFPLSAVALVTDWQIVPNESTLTFTGKQNGSPISGEFKKFTGEIKFDPLNLHESHIKIIVDINSINLTFKDIEDTLKSKDWFDIKLFPTATFEADNFVKLGDDHYQAKGKLTIRNKAIPIDIDFTKEKGPSNNKVKVKGEVSIKRTQFEVGKGEWGSTDEVEDDVKVNFVLAAEKKGL